MSASTVEASRLAVVADYVDVRPETRADLTALCEIAAMVCDVPNAAVNLIDDRSQHQVAAWGVDPSICAKDDSMCAVTVAGGRDVHVDDASTDDRFAANPWVDGRLGAVRLYASALLRSPAGHFVGTLCVFAEQPGRLPERRLRALSTLAGQVVDIFELQLRTRHLAETVDELARSQEQLAAFAGQVSHDLKTPLTATIGFAEMLGELPCVAADPTAARYAERCLASGQRMFAMIDDLLGYARLGGTLAPRPVPLDEVLPAVLEDLGAAAANADVRWSGVEVVADPTQLRALLQNLVGNALAYRRADRPAVVRVSAERTPLGTELVVSDNGSGIPADKRGEVLAPLARLRTDIPGTGLGLATCTRIVAAHNGSLYLGDGIDGGLAVTVLLPG